MRPKFSEIPQASRKKKKRYRMRNLKTQYLIEPSKYHIISTWTKIQKTLILPLETQVFGPEADLYRICPFLPPLCTAGLTTQPKIEKNHNFLKSEVKVNTSLWSWKNLIHERPRSRCILLANKMRLPQIKLALLIRSRASWYLT